MWMGLDELRQSFFITIYFGSCCYFASFVHLSSFNPYNYKGTKKQSFPNISTETGLILRRI
ncbi:hypothetical protein Hanom_Chr13g01201791 [Helianthus anomalus]